MLRQARSAIVRRLQAQAECGQCVSGGVVWVMGGVLVVGVSVGGLELATRPQARSLDQFFARPAWVAAAALASM